jgi:Domain of unknown function (DUF4153)
MTANMQQRWAMMILGLLAGLSLYGLGEIADRDLLAMPAVLALAAFAATFFTAALTMAGPVALPRAVAMALGLAAVVAALISLAGLRFDPVAEIFDAPLILLAAVVVSLLPLPFLIGWAGPGWSDYSSLFNQAWGIFVRLSFAWIFVGVVWGLILLSGVLFELVGVTLIKDLLEIDAAAWAITGAVFGLALAVVNELSDFVSPFLILRLLRLLLPLVLGVLVVFLTALPFRGLTGLFGGMSSAATLLAMVAAAVTLISAAVDESDEDAVADGWMAHATRLLAVLLPLPAGLAIWAMALRVGQYGWTPERLFAAVIAALGAAYALSYATSVLRKNWRANIRSVNIVNALAVVAAAVLWLTPLLNAERIATHSQMARFAATGDPAVLDFWAMARWGQPGATALAALRTQAGQAGQEALALAMDGTPADDPDSLTDARQALVAVMPLQPATATATRDGFLAASDVNTLQRWTQACAEKLPDGAPGCVMVVADLYPGQPGDEAIFAQYSPVGYISYTGLRLDGNRLDMRQILPIFDASPTGVQAQAELRALQTAPPVLVPAPLNMLKIGEAGLIMVP